MPINVLCLHKDDNVVTAIRDLEEGDPLQADVPLAGTHTRQAIPFGHKVALLAIMRGEHVIKYGASIGIATEDIRPGEHVHVHNLASVRGDATR